MRQEVMNTRFKEDAMRQVGARCTTFDALVEWVCRYLSDALAELITRNKEVVGSLLSSEITSFTNWLYQDTVFEFHLSFSASSESVVISPSLDRHVQVLGQALRTCENIVYNNEQLLGFINSLSKMLFLRRVPQALSINYVYEVLCQMKTKSAAMNRSRDSFMQLATRDAEKAKKAVREFAGLKQVWEFARQWEAVDESRFGDIELCKQTWLQMDKFNSMIDEVPAHPMRFNSIVLCTPEFREQLASIPRQVVQSIESRVVEQLERVTSALKQDLGKSAEILQQTPNVLNVYVEQVNTIKALRETADELNQRFDSLKKFSELCSSDRIVVSEQLSASIAEIERYFEQLPGLLA